MNSVTSTQQPDAPAPPGQEHVGVGGGPGAGRRRRRPGGGTLAARGEPMVWLIGGGLMLCVIMIVGLLGLIFFQGVSTFWPKRLVELTLADGQVLLGEYTRGEWFDPVADDDGGELAALLEEAGEDVDADADADAAVRPQQYRQLVRIGNRDIAGTPFQWVPDAAVEQERQPEWAVLLERRTWGPFIGYPAYFIENHRREHSEDEQALSALLELLQQAGDALGADDRSVAVDMVNAALTESQEESARAFLAAFEGVDDHAVKAVLPGNQSRPLAEALADEEVDPATIERVRERWEGPAAAWARFSAEHGDVIERRDRRRSLERHDIGALNYIHEQARLAVRSAELTHNVALLNLARQLLEKETALAEGRRQQQDAEAAVSSAAEHFGPESEVTRIVEQAAGARREQIGHEIAEIEAALAGLRGRLADVPDAAAAAVERYVSEVQQVRLEQQAIMAEIAQLNAANQRLELHLETADGSPSRAVLADIVRGYPANQLTFLDRIGVYGSRWREFITDNPREANTEGGVLPPIIGTVTMTLLMCFLVVPFGVLAALYLREYAKPGPIVSAVRIAVNNLAGVPSIVFGVFGLGFFCYIVGGYIDEGPSNPAGQGPWMLAMAVLVGVVALAILATTIKWRAPDERRTSIRILGYAAVTLWIVAAGVTIWLVVKVPFFDGFYAARAADGHPTFRKGGVLWASLTLALLTLPVVIVATEEALAAVPRSMREGSYACGASKWQTVRRIVLPRAMPGIMTGMILAMARGAGEVAPLMLVGAVTMAQELPVDAHFPYVHLDRSFMHLGFHIYDVGFQSPDSEGAKPMVYTTTLLLVGIIAALNMAAFSLRTRLRRRFAGSQF